VFTYKTFNKIAAVGLIHLPDESFLLDNDATDPDAILVRSASLLDTPIPESVLCISRAGAGTNNIPVSACSEKAIVVFNTPGANANAVRELTLCGIFLAARDIVNGITWAKGLSGEDVPAQVEKGKGAFVGPELTGKVLGIIGLGAIGGAVANTARQIGMDVIGFDPFLSVESAWGLSRDVRRAKDVQQVFAESDIITLHIPMNSDTRKMIADMFSLIKPGVRILNFSRGDLIDTAAMLDALDSGLVAKYVTDFPNEALCAHPKVVAIPHLGASTPESEENCAIMACEEMRDYLLYGNIRNSVNMPDVELPHFKGYRICVLHRNVPNVLSEISTIVGEAGINIENLLSRSRKEFAYAVLDVASAPPTDLVEKLNHQAGILRVRTLCFE
jgi:D-3-phosphoglycerate dehydrogenase